MLAFWIENWFLCSFFVANRTINSSSLLVIIFFYYHCLSTGVTILGKPRWQEISSKILDTGIVCNIYVNIASEGTKFVPSLCSSVKGYCPLDLRLRNSTLVVIHSGQNWLLFYGNCIWCEENETHNLGIPVFLGILWSH